MIELSKKLSKETLKNMYLIRHFETRVEELFANGKIPGFVHLYIGEEAVAVGTCSALRKDDYVVSTHRGHGHCIAKGADPKLMMAELFAKSTGYCKGKGGSMHVAALDIGMIGATAIVGAGIPLGTGAALAFQIKGTDQVAVCYFGDGASNQGTFHESLNLASVWKLPVIYVCENNYYAETVTTKEAISSENVAKRAVSYNIPSWSIDGNDVVEVYETMTKAVKRARGGEGPSLIECNTYRWRGHFEGEEILYAAYRSKEEIEEWKKKCPIKRFRNRLLKDGILTDKEADHIDEEAKREIDEAVEFAERSPPPRPEEALEDVYSGTLKGE